MCVNNLFAETFLPSPHNLISEYRERNHNKFYVYILVEQALTFLVINIEIKFLLFDLKTESERDELVSGSISFILSSKQVT